jgi:hypothetical protein
LAKQLGPDIFGQWVLIFSCSNILSAISTFGKLESTYAAFPSFSMNNDIASVVRYAHVIRSSFVRFLAIGLFFVLIVYLFHFGINVSATLAFLCSWILAVIFFAFASSIYSLYSSVLRGCFHDRSLIARASFLRSLLSFAGSCLLYNVLIEFIDNPSPQSLLISESIILSCAGLILLHRALSALERESSVCVINASTSAPLIKPDYSLWAFSLISVIASYGTRPAVALIAGNYTLASYSLLMTFASVGSSVGSVFAQYTAKSVSNAIEKRQYLFLSRQIVGSCVAGALIVSMFYFALFLASFGMASSFFDTYSIDGTGLLLSFLVAIASAHTLFYFLLASSDFAFVLPYSIAAGVFLVFGGFILSRLLGFGLTGYLAASILGESIQFALMFLCYRKFMSPWKLSKGALVG